MLHDDIDTDLLNASMYTPPLSKETMPATSSTEGTIGNKMSKDPRTVFLGNNKYIYIYARHRCFNTHMPLRTGDSGDYRALICHDLVFQRSYTFRDQQ